MSDEKRRKPPIWGKVAGYKGPDYNEACQRSAMLDAYEDVYDSSNDPFELTAIPVSGSITEKGWRIVEEAVQPPGCKETFKILLKQTPSSKQPRTYPEAQRAIDRGFGDGTSDTTTIPCDPKHLPRHIKLQYNYVDGTGVPGARYIVKKPDGSLLKVGKLDGKGSARINGLPCDLIEFIYSFHEDPQPYVPDGKPIPNPLPAPAGLYQQRHRVAEGVGQLDLGHAPR